MVDSMRPRERWVTPAANDTIDFGGPSPAVRELIASLRRLDAMGVRGLEILADVWAGVELTDDTHLQQVVGYPRTRKRRKSISDSSCARESREMPVGPGPQLLRTGRVRLEKPNTCLESAIYLCIGCQRLPAGEPRVTYELAPVGAGGSPGLGKVGTAPRPRTHEPRSANCAGPSCVHRSSRPDQGLPRVAGGLAPPHGPNGSLLGLRLHPPHRRAVPGGRCRSSPLPAGSHPSSARRPHTRRRSRTSPAAPHCAPRNAGRVRHP